VCSQKDIAAGTIKGLSSWLLYLSHLPVIDMPRSLGFDTVLNPFKTLGLSAEGGAGLSSRRRIETIETYSTGVRFVLT